MKICIIASNFYPKVTNLLLEGAKKKLHQFNIKSFRLIKVPGTYEIPYTLSKISHQYDGFIVLGCVIKGETKHFNFLCSSVFNALMTLSINLKIPIGNGILTCNNKKQALKRANPKKKNKGGDAANALISLIKINIK
mgnify:CR=1 FL=1|tara:strand:- start:108 stop:518 length:411 start_codon:yes stop_codon:yes gene_type:complete